MKADLSIDPPTVVPAMAPSNKSSDGPSRDVVWDSGVL
ncbi:MAG: hypothetical protein RLZZ565_1438, partial [Planctomycetota bacterium]